MVSRLQRGPRHPARARHTWASGGIATIREPSNVGPREQAVRMCWKCDHPDATVDDHLDELRKTMLESGRGGWPWAAAFSDGRGRQPVLGVRDQNAYR